VNISSAATEIAEQAATITGLNAYDFAPGTIVPPCLVVLNPEPGGIVFDQTYGRGMDRITLPVILICGPAVEREQQQGIRLYLDGAGDKSIKQVLESGTYESFDTIRVMVGGVDGVTIGGVEYIAALFDIDLGGRGT
jgi:hypothetical protein